MMDFTQRGTLDRKVNLNRHLLHVGVAVSAVTMLTAASPQVAPPAAPAQWTPTERAAASGVKTTSAAAIAKDGASRLIVKCDVVQDAVVSIQFLQPSPIGQSPDKTVTMRFDGGPGIAYNWEFPGPGVFIRDPGAVTALTMMLVKAKTIGVETTNSSNFAVQAVFPGPPSDAPIRKVLAACGQTLGVVPPPPAAEKAK